jgi:GH24 family phage-related lysozyme (muramidase)
MVTNMMFNMGATRFTKEKWKEFFKALDRNDMQAAAKESHRSSGDTKRNNWARDTLLGIKK